MRPVHLLGLGFLTLSVACAASGRTQSVDQLAPDATAPSTGEDTKPEDPATAPPHALGTIVLGESRSSSTGDSSPVISATFVPDAKLTKSCTKKVDVCEVTELPTCMTGSAQGCGTGELCTFDDACTAKCVKNCTKACGAGEACYFTSTATTTSEAGMSCKKKDRFDAGAIAFDGTTQSITLFPPYAVTPTGNGAPFLARSEIRVQAAGAASAGFEKFDEKFTSTTFLETEPPLRDLSRSLVFGSGALDIGWVAGEDTVYVTAAGIAGTAKCTADDKTGTFTLPRSVVRQVMDSESTGAASLSIMVTRERREVKKGKKAFGELSGGQTVQPEGWVELITRSTEAHNFASCATSMSSCDDVCTNLQADSKNCGVCGKICPPSSYCSVGACR